MRCSAAIRRDTTSWSTTSRRLLAAIKRALGERVTTVFVRQGHYAAEAAGSLIEPSPDIAIDRIGDLAEVIAGERGCFQLRRSGSPASVRCQGCDMNQTTLLRDLGQSLWLDNITRELLDNGTLRRYIDEYSITGLTSNPTIFDEAIGGTDAYDAGIREQGALGRVRRSVVHRAGARRPAPRGRPVPPGVRRDGWRRRLGVDGTVAAARGRHRRQHRGRKRHPSRRPTGPTFSSRFRERPKAFRRSKSRSSTACRSTSRCCSRPTSTSPPPRPTCAASSAASPPAAIRAWHRSRRCS